MSKTAKDLRIIFLGTPEFATATLAALVENGYNVVAVITNADKPAGRGRQLSQSDVKQYALSKNIPVLQPERLKNKLFLNALKALNADIQVVVAFRMLPEAVWNMPPMGTINVHASLLPQYRGAAPINWAIINGEKFSGVTTFKLQHEIDTGDILLQDTVNIPDGDNVGYLYEKLKNAGASLLLKTINGIAAKTVTPTPQSYSAKLQTAPKIYKETGLIDWENTTTSIHNLIRGLSPYPGAYTFLHEKMIKILVSKPIFETHMEKTGSIDTDSKTYLKFAASDGWIDCIEIQIEGKKRMSIPDFLRGYKL